MAKSETTTTAKSKPKANPWIKFVSNVSYGLFLCAVFAISTGIGWINTSAVGGSVFKQMFIPRPPEEVFKGDKNLTLLILGCDQVTDERTKRVLKRQARSDMMLVANLDFENRRITGLSIPRDTVCDLPGYPGHKINAYHNIAKPGEEAELTQKAVEYLLPGVTIDRVLTLDYDEFQKMVDLVGGIKLNVERDMDYDDNSGQLHIHLKAGEARLNGSDAMGYVRYRHGDDDFHRQDRQKHFLVAFKDQLVRNWTQIGVVADQARHAIGDTLTPDEVASIALFAKGMRPENIKMGMLPVNVNGTEVEVDKRLMKKALKEFNLVSNNESKDATGSERVSEESDNERK